MSEETQRRILRLAGLNMSKREISKVVGVSRGSVGKVMRYGKIKPVKNVTCEHKCEGCGRMIRVSQCVVCRDRKTLGIKLD